MNLMILTKRLRRMLMLIRRRSLAKAKGNGRDIAILLFGYKSHMIVFWALFVRLP